MGLSQTQAERLETGASLPLLHDLELNFDQRWIPFLLEWTRTPYFRVHGSDKLAESWAGFRPADALFSLVFYVYQSEYQEKWTQHY